MKTRALMFLVVVLCCAATLRAQKADFAAAERFAPENLREMVGDRRVTPHWLHDSDRFWYSYETGEGTNYYLVDPQKGTKELLFDRYYLASRLSEVTKKPLQAEALPLKNIALKKNNVDFEFEVEKLKFRYNIKNATVAFIDSVEEEARTPRWPLFSPDSSWIVFAKNHDLHLMRADDPDSVELRLTTDGERWYSYAANDADTSGDRRVRANAYWFKDSKKLYVRRRDRREVKELWLVHSLSEPRPTLETYKYEMPGEKHVPQTELIIFDAATQRRVDVKIEKWVDQNIGGVYTGSTSEMLYFTRMNRPSDKIDVCRVDTDNGTVAEIISEESKPYFNTRGAQLHVIENGAELIWWSERKGWGHFYLYDGEGRLKNEITGGAYLADAVVKIDTAKRVLYFVGYGRERDIDPYYQMYYRVDFDGNNLQLLTPENATHSFDMSASCKYFIDTFSRVDAVPVSVLRDARGKILRELETMDVTMLEASGWKKPEIFTVKAADGITDLYGVMWKPFEFDPEKKYPVISYVYPGPQSEPVPKEFFVVRNERVHNVPLAQLGFIVISVGQRGGSPLRSKWYHTFGYGNARDYPLEDNKYAIEQLANRYPFIDIERVGIYGRSGGGFMSTAAMLVYPDFYDVAVSSCGNHDNNVYNRGWGEFHYGVEEIEKVIEDSSGTRTETVFETSISANPELAENLKGKLLLLHGEVDNNVHPANTFRMVDALIKAGKRFDLMIFPGKRHTYGEYTRYIERMMWYYFAEHLLGDYRSTTEMFAK